MTSAIKYAHSRCWNQGSMSGFLVTCIDNIQCASSSVIAMCQSVLFFIIKSIPSTFIILMNLKRKNEIHDYPCFNLKRCPGSRNLHSCDCGTSLVDIFDKSVSLLWTVRIRNEDIMGYRFQKRLQFERCNRYIFLEKRGNQSS